MNLELLALVATALLGFGLVSRRAERSVFTPPLVFLALGITTSPVGLGWFDLETDREVLHAVAELTLGLVLFTDAARIDVRVLRREGSLPLRLLGVGMPLCVLLGTLLAVWLLPDLAFWECVLLAAVLAPTDAALGQAVVSSDRVPLRIRQSLNVESGLNDGIALPLVLGAAALAGADLDQASWLRFVLLQVTLGPLTGALVGVVGGWGLLRARASGSMGEAFERLSALALAVLAFAGAELVGGNGFIAAFVAGLGLGNTAGSACRPLYDFGEAEGQLLTLLVFLAAGLVLVPEALARADAAAWLYAGASLTVVRMLPVALALLGTGLRPASYAFLAWFGPRGLASLIFALLIVERHGLTSAPRIASVAYLTVLLSTLAHGVSAYPLARAYGQRLRAHGDAPEHDWAPELPVRIRHGHRRGTGPSRG